MAKKYLIVGGVAGGMSAATRLRRLQEEAEIIVFEKGPHVSFANCGLPYYLSGEIEERDQLIVQTSASLRQRFNLDIRENSEVVAIDATKKTVRVRTKNQEYQESYDALILSPGAKPLLPSLTGLSEATNVFSLRNIPDVDQIMTFLKEKQPSSAVVIGAGFIGLEMAENLKKRGLSVTIVEKAAHVLPTLDQEMAIPLQNELEKQQVKVLTQRSAIAIQANQLVLDNQEVLSADLVILSVGVQPETDLAASAGIELGLKGGILVDEHYETSLADIYAVGDAIVVKEQISGQPALISLASPANRQGRQVADILSGLPVKNRGSIGTAIVRTFERTAASTGMSERNVQALGLPYKV
ncbi:NAD(P)/FAD-dependent oxidoreductase, partial [Lactococcus taiwanensis]